MKRIGSLDTFMEAALTFPVLGKLKNSISEIPKFPYTLNINNERTKSENSINLGIIRKLIKYSFKDR